MTTIEELQKNINKMQELLTVAQNAVQRKTFEDIINALTQQLELEEKTEKEFNEQVL